jgi:cardiolipin synthase
VLRASDARFTRGNRIELFRTGEDGLRAMLACLRGAQDRIHFESYIFRTDDTGREFLDVMTEKARRGVEVRLLYDAIGSRDIDPWQLEPLREAGADVTVFNPLGRIYPRWAPRTRDHRKILVVDGEVAFTGGLNIGDEYRMGPMLAEGRRVPWRDAHLRCEGPVVQLLEAVFLESWFRADGPDRPWTDLGSAVPARGGETSVGLVADGPTYHRRRMRDLFVEALERTNHTARIATPYFTPGSRLRQALCAAAERGVSVEILLAGYTDHPIMRWAARARVPALLRAGVRVFECEHAMMHAKLAVLDDSLGIVGTSNLDRQSLRHSYEVNLVVEGGGVPEQLASMIGEDLEGALELTPALLERRSLPERWRDRLAAMLMSRI